MKIRAETSKTTGVLVAISIPIFTSQLNKSRMATDKANIRSYYAQVVTANLDGIDSETWPTGDVSSNIPNFPALAGATATASGTGNSWKITYSGDGTVIGQD